MKNKNIYMSLLVGVTAVSISGAAIALSSKKQTTQLVRAATVSHRITFDKNDSVVLVAPENEKGVEITKNNATRSGHQFVMKTYCYGNGGYYSYINADCLLYCETKGVLSDNPDSYVRVDFTISNIASFTSVILHGTFYTNSGKNSSVSSMTIPATYDVINNKITGQVKPFKAIVTSIELNYTCAV